MFDCLHDMGDPVGAARHVREQLAPDGTWMIVEPLAGDAIEENLNPVGRVFYGVSTMLCTPASFARGRARARRAGGRGSVSATWWRRRASRRFRRVAETPFNLVLRGAAVSAERASRQRGYGSRDRARTDGSCEAPAIGRDGEQSRARYPDAEGFVERDGQRLFYEVYGEGEETDLPAADLVAGPLAPLEDADPLLRAPLPGADDGRPRQRPLRSLPRPAALRSRGVRARLPGRDGRDRHRASGDGEPLARRPVPAGAGAARPRARRRRRLHRPAVPLHPVALVGPAHPRPLARFQRRSARPSAGGGT